MTRNFYAPHSFFFMVCHAGSAGMFCLNVAQHHSHEHDRTHTAVARDFIVGKFDGRVADRKRDVFICR
jgi:hypothetical protein